MYISYTFKNKSIKNYFPLREDTHKKVFYPTHTKGLVVHATLFSSFFLVL